MIGPPHTPTKGEVAFDTLRAAIRSGELRPGQKLTLNGLADTLGMSLTPVREALRKLAEQGLVLHTPNKGTVVAEYTAARAREIYWLRLTLEPLAAAAAAERASTATVEKLRACCRAVEQAVAGGRHDDVPALNAELHRRMYEACGSTYLCDFIARLWDGVPFQAISLAGRHEEANAEHRDIVDALARKDGATASSLLAAHIEAGAEAVFAQLATMEAEKSGA